MSIYVQKTILLCLSVAIIATLGATYFGVANAQENKTLIQPQASQGMSSNGTNIILVHGGWADGSSWGKVITILKNAGQKVIAVNMPLHNLADDVATVKRAIEL